MRRLLPFLLLLLAAALGASAQQEERAVAPSFLERQLQSLVPGLQVEGLEGAWRAAPRARRMTLADSQGVWLVLDDVRLNIAPTALLRGVLRLEGLEAQRMEVRRLPAADPGAPAAPADPNAGVIPGLPDLPVDLALDRLAVAELLLQEPVLGQAARFALEGQGRLGEGRLTAQLELRRLDAEGRAAIDLALDPPQDRLRATVTLREPEGGLGPGLIGVPQYPLALDLSLDGPAAAGAALSLQAALGPELGLAAEGTVRAGGDGALGAQLTGTARIAPLLPPEAAPLASPAQFALDAAKPAGSQVVTLTRLALDLPAGQAAVAGSLDLAREAPDLTVTLALPDAARFAALLPPGLAWEAARAVVRITGTLAAPRIALEAAPQGLATGIPQADAVLGPAPRLAGTVALPGPVLDLALEGAAGRLALAGSLAAPIDVTARLALPDLGVLGAGSEGALRAEARATGSLADPSLTLAAESGRIAVGGRVLEGIDLAARVDQPLSAPRAEARLAARLDGQPIRLALRGQPEGAQGLRLAEAELRVGEDAARLTAEGLLDTAALLFDGSARLEARDLALLGRLGGVPGLAGRVSLAATLAPRDGAQGIEARLEAPLLGLGGNALAGVEATVAGTPAALAWTLAGRGGGDLPLGRFAGRGRVEATEAGGRRLDLAALEAELAGEALRLAGPARITLGPDGGVEIGETVILAAGGRLQASGRWGPERADLAATVTALPLALAARFAPGVQPEGTLSGQLRVTGPTAAPEIRATLQGSGIKAGAAWAQGLPALGLTAEARLDAGGAAEARAVLEAGPAGRLQASARLPRGFGPEATIAATADGALDLAPLSAPFLAGGADRVTGRVVLALRAEGPLAAPRPGGRVTLQGVEYRNPATGVRLSGINGSLVADGERLLVQDLAGRTPGGGRIALSGSLAPLAPGIPADLVLTARNARPVTSPYGTATLNADLRLAGPLLAPGGGLAGRLAGRVDIAGAELRIPETLPASAPVLPNVRIRGTPPPGAVPPPEPPPPGAVPAPGTGLPPIALEVTVTTSRPIFVRGRGIEAELGGDVTLGGTLAAPVPTGGLTLRRGTLDVLARRLTFQRGTISFATGTLQPVLDLAAVSRTRTATITVGVQGTPAAPEITFSSVPELPQDEVLSRLLFDRATSNLSPFEIAQLAQAVAQLTGVSSGPDVLDKIRGALGLDRLGVTTDPQGRAAVEAGRYVAPGVFLGVRQGAQGQTGVAVELELTPRLRLEGQTATGPAGDRIGLSYEFEY